MASEAVIPNEERIFSAWFFTVGVIRARTRTRARTRSPRTTAVSFVSSRLFFAGRALARALG